jgi:hypothetical protein
MGEEGFVPGPGRGERCQVGRVEIQVGLGVFVAFFSLWWIGVFAGFFVENMV